MHYPLIDGPPPSAYRHIQLLWASQAHVHTVSFGSGSLWGPMIHVWQILAATPPTPATVINDARCEVFKEAFSLIAKHSYHSILHLPSHNLMKNLKKAFWWLDCIKHL